VTVSTGSTTEARVLRIPATALLTMLLASVLTLGAFGWPFVVPPGGVAEASSHGTDAPWLFVLVLPVLIAIVLAEMSTGGIDAKAITLLGMLAAVGGALRALSPGVAGLEPSFAVIMLGGRVLGPGFGFVQGNLTLLVGALLTGGVGPWLPFQMMAAGWVGLLAGLLPRWRGWLEVVMLAVFGLVLGIVYGLLMNLWFWPFARYGEGLSFEAGASTAHNLASYLRFYVATSVVWDLARGVATFLLMLLAGRPLLRALRRVSRLARFDATARFVPHADGVPSGPEATTSGEADA
jgi:energy-coupling factor transport system substrate-specific component